MEIALGIVIVFFFIITWIVIATNAPESEYDNFLDKKYQMNPPYDFEKEALRRELEMTKLLNVRLEKENTWMKATHLSTCCLYGNHHCKCGETVIYAKSPEEQKIVDLLKKTIKPLDEIKKEFGITN